MKGKLSLLIIGLLAALIIMVAGCSEQNVSGPVENQPGFSEFVMPDLAAAPGDSVMFAARVQTMDQNTLMLTFKGRSDTVIAAHNCEIVRFNNGREVPIPFSDICPGDSLEVRGAKLQNHYILAHRIRNFMGEGRYDLAIRDTIISIDYNALSFYVSSRPEAILVDSNTVIWGTVTYRWNYSNQINGDNPSSGNAGKMNYQVMSFSRDTLLTFADLAEGDVIELRVNIIDSATLLAVSIKVANCQDPTPKCSQFTAALSTIDTEARIVTFDGLNWIGFVCKGTRLFAADGTELTLADFAVGETVNVKGLSLTGDTLKVCLMEKTE
jgi:hypothetical protein